MSTDDLRAELVAQRASRVLSPSLISLVAHSPMIPERSVQQQTLRWLQGQTPEERAVFAGMLERIEARAKAEAEDPDEVMVDEILATEADDGDT